MPIQYIPGEKGLGTILGESLGQGLGAGVQSLAQQKLEQMQRQNQQNQYKKAVGQYFDPEFANLLAVSDPKDRRALLENYSALQAMRAQRNPQAQPTSQIDDILASLRSQQAALPQMNLGQPGQKLSHIMPELNQPVGMQDLLSGLKSGNYPLSPSVRQAIGKTPIVQPDPYAQLIQEYEKLQKQQKAQPSGRAEQTQELPKNLFESPVERRHRESLDLQRQIAEDRRQDKIEASNKPFFDKHNQDLKESEAIEDHAREALRLLNLNESKFPTGIMRFTPEQLINDPDVRNFAAEVNALVIALAQSRKGVPTNFKVKLEQLAKPNLNQPNRTKRELLEKTIARAEKPKIRQNIIEEIKQENNGNYPRNIEQIIQERYNQKKTKEKYNTIKELLSTLPEDAQEGETFTDDVTGREYIYSGGTLVEVK